jgi:LPXTG-motif cell wall-anchored protein
MTPGPASRLARGPAPLRGLPATDGGPAPGTGPTDEAATGPAASGELPRTGDATVLSVLLALALLGTGAVLVAMRTLRRPTPRAG